MLDMVAKLKKDYEEMKHGMVVMLAESGALDTLESVDDMSGVLKVYKDAMHMTDTCFELLEIQSKIILDMYAKQDRIIFLLENLKKD